MASRKKMSNENSNHQNSDRIDLKNYPIDHKRRYYPFTIVWTPVPLISWLFPHAGHLGIGKSDGHVKDFGWSYKVFTDSTMLGRPLKYMVLDPNLAKGGIKGWDDAIEEASIKFCTKKNFILVSNCHSHVSTVLNNMQYNGRSDWNEHKLFWFFNKNYKYVSCWTFIKTWLPLTLIVIGTVLAVLYAKTDVFDGLLNKK